MTIWRYDRLLFACIQTIRKNWCVTSDKTGKSQTEKETLIFQIVKVKMFCTFSYNDKSFLVFMFITSFELIALHIWIFLIVDPLMTGRPIVYFKRKRRRTFESTNGILHLNPFELWTIMSATLNRTWITEHFQIHKIVIFPFKT